MNIVIVGGGVVGTATGLGFQRLGHDVQVWDVRGDCLAAAKGLPVANAPPWASWRRASPTDVIFFCVPESKIDEATLAVHQVLAPVSKEDGLTVGRVGFDVQDIHVPFYIRSSVPVGTCKRLSEKYGRHVGHNPEFLREAVAEYEFLNPPAVILGNCCHRHGGEMQKLYRSLRVLIHHTTPEVSELTKLAVNGYLACQVSYWNQVNLLADALGVNSHEVGMLASHCDDRVSVYGSRMHGRPYGGKCLPKDLRQLIDLCEAQKVAVPLLHAVATVNYMMGSEGELERRCATCGKPFTSRFGSITCDSCRSPDE